MKTFLTGAAAAFAVAVSGTVHMAEAASPYGTWQSDTGRHIEVFDCDGGLGMKIVKAAKKEHIGKTIMCGAKKTGDNRWKGRLLNVDNGKTYTGIATLESADSLKLEGCVFIGLICKAQTWPRIK